VERRKGQRYGSELRRQAVERMNAGGNIVGLAREFGVSGRIALYLRLFPLPKQAFHLLEESG
jgi:transposase-like protein